MACFILVSNSLPKASSVGGVLNGLLAEKERKLFLEKLQTNIHERQS